MGVRAVCKRKQISVLRIGVTLSDTYVCINLKLILYVTFCDQHAPFGVIL